MAGDVSLELWLHQYKMEALERVMHESGTDTQTVMQARLEELYRQYVPSQERTDINNTIEGERLTSERRAEENDSFAVFHVHENGNEEYYRTKLFSDLLGAARALRRHLRDENAAHISFAERFSDRVAITPESFESYVLERMDNTGRIEGAFDLDFDKMEFSGVNIMDGWQTFAMHDVSTAVYLATKDASEYLTPVLTQILRGTLDGFGAHISRNLFRLAVEEAKTWNLIAGSYNVTPETLQYIHNKAIGEVKRMNGWLTYEQVFANPPELVTEDDAEEDE